MNCHTFLTYSTDYQFIFHHRVGPAVADRYLLSESVINPLISGNPLVGTFEPFETFQTFRRTVIKKYEVMTSTTILPNSADLQ